MVLEKYDRKTPMEIACERENVTFLKEAVAYSSSQHTEAVFLQACASGRRSSALVLQEEYPDLRCPQVVDAP